MDKDRRGQESEPRDSETVSEELHSDQRRAGVEPEDSEESAHKARMQALEEGGHSFGSRGRSPWSWDSDL